MHSTLRRDAFDLGYTGIFLAYLGLVLDFVPDNVERAVEACFEIGELPFGGVHPRKVLEVLDNPADPLQPFERFVDQRPDVAAHVIEVGSVPRFGDRFHHRRMPGEDRVGCHVGVDRLQQAIDFVPQAAKV